jgi:DNA repair exonuclease SbcCD ATPase subunit
MSIYDRERIYQTAIQQLKESTDDQRKPCSVCGQDHRYVSTNQEGITCR